MKHPPAPIPCWQCLFLFFSPYTFNTFVALFSFPVSSLNFTIPSFFLFPQEHYSSTSKRNQLVHLRWRITLFMLRPKKICLHNHLYYRFDSIFVLKRGRFRIRAPKSDGSEWIRVQNSGTNSEYRINPLATLTFFDSSDGKLRRYILVRRNRIVTSKSKFITKIL
jgi:hypothetical protein